MLHLTNNTFRKTVPSCEQFFFWKFMRKILFISGNMVAFETKKRYNKQEDNGKGKQTYAEKEPMDSSAP